MKPVFVELQNGALVNLSQMASMSVQETDRGTHAIIGMFGAGNNIINLFEGKEVECEAILDNISSKLNAFSIDSFE